MNFLLELPFWFGALFGAFLILVVLTIVGTGLARRGRALLKNRDSYNRQLGAEAARASAAPPVKLGRP